MKQQVRGHQGLFPKRRPKIKGKNKLGFIRSKIERIDSKYRKLLVKAEKRKA